ncbi:MAG: hypothetical protein II169_01700 [Lachnospiraceae bacterium]|nr:hypothetical protein [Lachnospiraceae bacterium]
MASRSQLISQLATAMNNDGFNIEMPNHYDRSTGTFYIRGSEVTKNSAKRALRFFEEKVLKCPNSVRGQEELQYYNIAIASIKKCLEENEQDDSNK